MNYPLDNIGLFKDARLISYCAIADRPGKRLGAILHKGRRKLSFGHNLFGKTHPMQMHEKESLHAEVQALIKRRHYDDVSSCEMTVYRETYDGKPAMAKPCKSCQIVLRAFGIKTVYYSIPIEPFWCVMKLNID